MYHVKISRQYKETGPLIQSFIDTPAGAMTTEILKLWNSISGAFEAIVFKNSSMRAIVPPEHLPPPTPPPPLCMGLEDKGGSRNNFHEQQFSCLRFMDDWNDRPQMFWVSIYSCNNAANIAAFSGLTLLWLFNIAEEKRLPNSFPANCSSFVCVQCAALKINTHLVVNFFTLYETK